MTTKVKKIRFIPVPGFALIVFDLIITAIICNGWYEIIFNNDSADMPIKRAITIGLIIAIMLFEIFLTAITVIKAKQSEGFWAFLG